MIFCYRPREHRRLENGTIKPTRCAVDVVDPRFTFRRRLVLLVVIHLRGSGSVSWYFWYHQVKHPWYIWWQLHLILSDNWSVKAKRRKTTGTGRVRHLRKVWKRFANGFRSSGTSLPVKKVKGPAATPSSAWSEVWSVTVLTPSVPCGWMCLDVYQQLHVSKWIH